MAVENIDQILRQIKRERGRKAEPLADKAAKLLVDKGDIISDWWRATSSQDRILHVDRYALRVTDGNVIPIQIKSSERGQAIAQVDYPDIPILLVVVGESLEEIAANIARLVQNAI